MYDENAMYDETMSTIKSGIQTVQSISDMLKKLNDSKTSSEILNTTDTNFLFTGQSTDLRYFENHNEMPIKLVENISDEELKNAVKQEFNKAALSGKVEINKHTGLITITDKGKEFINKPSFKMAAAKDVANITQAQAQTLGFELDGTMQDLKFFNFSDKLDLNEIISNPDKQTVQKVLSNLGQMKDSGLISIDNSMVKITDKGKNLINSDVFKLSTQGVTEKALSLAGGAGKIVAVTKKLAETLISSATRQQ